MTVAASSVAAAIGGVLGVARGRPPRCGATRVIAVDGPSGAGKTVVAGALGAQLVAAGEEVEIIHLDDIYPGWTGVDKAPELLKRWVLAPISRGELAAYHRYDWASEAYADWVAVVAHPFLIVEGVTSAAPLCAPFLSAVLWVDAETEVRMARGLARDGETYRPHWERWAAQERAHFARAGTAAKADVSLDTTRLPLVPTIPPTILPTIPPAIPPVPPAP